MQLKSQNAIFSIFVFSSIYNGGKIKPRRRILATGLVTSQGYTGSDYQAMKLKSQNAIFSIFVFSSIYNGGKIKPRRRILATGLVAS